MTPRRALGLAVAAAIAGLIAGCKEANVYQPPPPAQVKVAKPIQRKATLYANFTGSTAASEQVDLVARVQGTLETVGFRDGDQVTKDQVLFTIEKAPYQISLQIAQAAVAQQEALLTQAEADLARKAALVQRQAEAQSSYDTSKAQRDSTAAALQQAKGQEQQAEINLGYTDVKAPFSGLIGARLVDPGALVGAGSPTKLATLVEVNPIYVNFDVSEQIAVRVRENLRKRGLKLKDLGPIPVEVGLQTESGYTHKGQIDYVSPTIDTTTGTLPVRATLDNDNVLFLPGLFVRVRVPSQNDVDVILVPDAALGTSQQGRYLLLVDAANKVVQQSVETGDLLDGGLRIITSGLKGDERVIVAGAQRVVPGDVVTPTEVDAASLDAPK